MRKKTFFARSKCFDKTFTKNLHANLATALSDATRKGIVFSATSEIAIVAHLMRCQFYFPQTGKTPHGSSFPNQAIEALWRTLSAKYADIIATCPIKDNRPRTDKRRRER